MPGIPAPASTAILPPVGGVQMVEPNGTFTPAGLGLFQQLWTAVFSGGAVTPGAFLLGFLDNINFNVKKDNQIVLNLPVGAVGWRPLLGMVWGTQGSFTTAKAGIYSVAFEQGTTLLGQTALSAITAVGFNVANVVANLTPTATAIFNFKTIYLNVGTAQGATSQGNFYLYGYPVY